ncbi:hypothetical protein KO465_02465 [Candidatus Micrarchaeota archaeon]|nr:hypothetical protein [Candidatus Micrarchaeota archaeon]
MRILLVSSAGGHFKELMRIYDGLDKKKHEIKIATVKRGDTEGKADYYITEISRNPINFFINRWESLKILWNFKPDLIMSTGAGTALNMCTCGRMLFWKKILYVETVSRVENLSLTGKILYYLRLPNKFIVQWPNLTKKYKRAEYWGRVL